MFQHEKTKMLLFSHKSPDLSQVSCDRDTYWQEDGVIRDSHNSVHRKWYVTPVSTAGLKTRSCNNNTIWSVGGCRLGSSLHSVLMLLLSCTQGLPGPPGPPGEGGKPGDQVCALSWSNKTNKTKIKKYTKIEYNIWIYVLTPRSWFRLITQVIKQFERCCFFPTLSVTAKVLRLKMSSTRFLNS